MTGEVSTGTIDPVNPAGATVDNESSRLVRILSQGLLICGLIATADYLAVSYTNSLIDRQWPVLVCMGLFVLQTIGLSIFVGRRVNESPVWWLFYWWSLVLVNLNLMLIQFGTDWSTRYLTALIFSFVTAQIGLVIFWGLLDSSPFAKRLTIGGALFVLCCYPYWLITTTRQGDAWLTVMTAYIVSVFLTCFVLRGFLRFRLSTSESTDVGIGTQFSISHLLIWTTVVAVLVGGGRFIDWPSVFLGGDSFASLAFRAILMTLLIVATAWAVMGSSKRLWWTLPLLLILLLGIGFGLYLVDVRTIATPVLASNWFWRQPTGLELVQLRNIWFVWSLLNGVFFSGLILVLRISGKKLTRFQSS